MPEQADAAAGKVASAGHAIGDIVVWILAILGGFAGYAMPQAGLDLPKMVTNMLKMFKLDSMFSSNISQVAQLIAGGIFASIGGTALYWGMKYDKFIGAIAKIGGAHLLGRGVRLILSGLGA